MIACHKRGVAHAEPCRDRKPPGDANHSQKAAAIQWPEDRTVD